MDRRPPACLLEADRRASEQLRVAERARELGGLRERVESGVCVPRPMAGLTHPQHHSDALASVGDAELERRAEPILGLVERNRLDRRLRCEEVVLDGTLDSADCRRLRVVVCERGEPGPAVAFRLERLRHPEVDLRLARGGETVGHRAADELVREAVGQPASRSLEENPAPNGLVDGVEQGGLRDDSGAANGVELELGAGHGGEGEQLVRLRREPREPLADDLAHGRRSAELGGRSRELRPAWTDLDRARLDEVAPELGHEERIPAGQLADDGRQSRRRLETGRQADELRDLVHGQPAEPDADDPLGSIDVDQRVGELGGDVGVRVPERGDEKHPRSGARAHEVTHQLQRRRVGPVHVLEHEQHRGLRADPDEQGGDGGVQPVALRVRVRRRRTRRVADAPRELGQQTGELRPAGA